MKTILTAKEQSLPHHNMIWVEGGSFFMSSKEGDNDMYEDESPYFEAHVSGFYLSQFQVTQGLWQEVMPIEFLPFKFKGDAYPMVNLNYYHAILFCNFLSVWAGRTPVYYTDSEFSIIFGFNDKSGWELTENLSVFQKPSANGYRLPTEVEWEFAAKGGIKSEGYKYAGSDKLKEVAWFDENSGNQTHRVGQKYANEIGFYDMSGNVWEWCEYKVGMVGMSDNNSNQVVEKQEVIGRILRGGSYFDYAERCSVDFRYFYLPAFHSAMFGFRMALSL